MVAILKTRVIGIAVLLVGSSATAQFQLEQVHFEAPRDVVMDTYSPGGVYSHALQWWDLDQDGFATTPLIDREFPLAYTAGGLMLINKVVVLGGLQVPGGASVWIEGIGPDEMTGMGTVFFGGDWATISGDEITAINLPPSQALPSTVRFYDPYEIDWWMQIFPAGADPWPPQQVGISRNRVFLTLMDNPPGNVKLYESMAQISCAAANRESFSLQITDKIFDEFDNLSLTRVPRNGINIIDGRPLFYYLSGGATCIDLEGMLYTQDGRCGAFNDLFWACVHLNNGLGSRVEIRPDPEKGDEYLVAPNVTLLTTKGTGQGTHPWVYPQNWNTSAAGVAGQNMVTPARKRFLNHLVYSYLSQNLIKVVDPSYGTTILASTPAQASIWYEDLGIWGWGVQTDLTDSARLDKPGAVDGLWLVQP